MQLRSGGEAVLGVSCTGLEALCGQFHAELLRQLPLKDEKATRQRDQKNEKVKAALCKVRKFPKKKSPVKSSEFDKERNLITLDKLQHFLHKRFPA